MLLGAVSDTHGHVEYTRSAVRMLESLEVDEVIHCGDIGSPEIVAMFRQWPTHFVFGNVDYDEPALRDAIRAAGPNCHCHERFGAVELAGKKIAFLHSDDTRLFRETIASGKWDLVCYGHTHVAKVERTPAALLLNPGALYRANPHSLAIVELPALRATHVEV